MNVLKCLQWSKALAFVAGGGLTVAFSLGGPKWTAAGPAVACLAGLLHIMLPTPAGAVVADAPIVTPSGSATGATNVSSTTQLFVPKE